MSSIIISSTTPAHIAENCEVIEDMEQEGLL
jgi:hypothetical protein